MAAAYQTWQNWKVEQVSLAATRPDQVHSSLDPKTRARLQTMARTEVSTSLENDVRVAKLTIKCLSVPL